MITNRPRMYSCMSSTPNPTVQYGTKFSRFPSRYAPSLPPHAGGYFHMIDMCIHDPPASYHHHHHHQRNHLAYQLFRPSSHTYAHVWWLFPGRVSADTGITGTAGRMGNNNIADGALRRPCCLHSVCHFVGLLPSRFQLLSHVQGQLLDGSRKEREREKEGKKKSLAPVLPAWRTHCVGEWTPGRLAVKNNINHGISHLKHQQLGTWWTGH